MVLLQNFVKIAFGLLRNLSNENSFHQKPLRTIVTTMLKKILWRSLPVALLQDLSWKSNFLLWCVLAGALMGSCKSTDKQTAGPENAGAKPVLFTVQNESVTMDEFLYVYNKNNLNRDSVDLQEDMREYLDLYVNFKLKVQEAKDSGLHQHKAFLDELEGYKKQLAKPYLTEKAVTEKLIREAYERLGTEVNASHILIATKQNPMPADTLEAYNKIVKLRERAKAGEDFQELAAKYSEDPSANTNGGNLGYFTALQMVYPFENAAYNTPVGGISQPVRTKFGYHLLKVHHKRPSQGKVKVAHIMIRLDEDDSPEEITVKSQKAAEIYKKLKEGGNWEQLAAQFSEDRATRSKGGELDWFGTGSLVPAFEDAAFSLKQKGQFSEPVRTPYGWHIIRLIERQPLPPLEEMRPELESRVSRDSRAQLQETALLARLRRENNLRENKENIQNLMSVADSVLMQGSKAFMPDSAEAAKTLFVINEQPFTVAHFHKWLSSQPKAPGNSAPESYLKSLFERWQNETLLAYEEEHLEDKYEDYRMLVQEYHDGILLFQLMDEKVWTKALEDTTGLKAYFLENQDQYRWKERIEGTLFSAAGMDILEQVEEKLKNPPYLSARLPVSAPAARQEVLGGNYARSLSKMISAMRNDSTAHLEIRLPKNSYNLEELIEKHLQSQAVEKSRYKILPATSQEGNLSVFTKLPKGLEPVFNQKAPLALQVLEGPFERGNHPVVDNVSWKPGSYKVEEGGRAYLVKIDAVLPPAPKKLDEVRGQVISDYQQHLEKQWIQSLRQKYEVEVNETVLEQTMRNPDGEI